MRGSVPSGTASRGFCAQREQDLGSVLEPCSSLLLGSTGQRGRRTGHQPSSSRTPGQPLLKAQCQGGGIGTPPLGGRGGRVIVLDGRKDTHASPHHQRPPWRRRDSALWKENNLDLNQEQTFLVKKKLLVTNFNTKKLRDQLVQFLKIVGGCELLQLWAGLLHGLGRGGAFLFASTFHTCTREDSTPGRVLKSTGSTVSSG